MFYTEQYDPPCDGAKQVFAQWPADLTAANFEGQYVRVNWEVPDAFDPWTPQHQPGDQYVTPDGPAVLERRRLRRR